jgi:hypothetical protein
MTASPEAERALLVLVKTMARISSSLLLGTPMTFGKIVDWWVGLCIATIYA